MKSLALAGGWRRMLALEAICLLVAGLAVGQQPTPQPQPGLESILSDLLRQELEEKTAGKGGRVREVEVAGAIGVTLVLRVQLAGVAFPERARLGCELYDRNLRPLPGFTAVHSEIPVGDSVAELHVTYTGGGTTFSSMVRVSLVDAAAGMAWDSKRVPLPREWASGEAVTSPGPAVTAGAAAAPGWEAQPASTPEPVHEPQMIDVVPVAVADTPAGSGSGGMRVPMIPGGAMARPAVVAAPAAVPQRQGSAQVVGRAQVVALAPIPLLDFYDLAPQAKWSGPSGPLPFNGSSEDSHGFVKPLGKRALSDGKSYDKVLQTHPAWVPDGFITSSYSVTIPANAKEFTSKLGFLPGVTQSDGVVASVIIGINKIATRVVRPADGVGELKAAIPEEWRGKKVVLHLMTATRATSTQDWFVLGRSGDPLGRWSH